MADVASAYVTLIPKFDSLSSSISDALSGASGSFEAAGSESASSFSSGFTKSGVIAGLVSTLASTVGSAISSSLDSAISRIDTLNAFPRIMSNLGYETEQAEAAMAKLTEGIEGLPTTLDDIVSNTQQLTLSLGDLDLATDVAIAMNDAMLTFGASSYDVTNAITQLNQMITTGTYDMQSWNSINSAAPGLLDTIAKSMIDETASASDLRNALNDGTITSDEFMAALVDLDQNGSDSITAFSQSAADATSGIGTAMTNCQSAITRNLANIIDAINGDEKLIENFFANLKSIINSVGGTITGGVQTLKSACSTMKSYLDMSGVTDKMSTALTNLKNSFPSLCSAMGNFVTSLVESETAENLVVAAGEAVVDIINWMANVISGAVDFISEFYSAFKNTGALTTFGDALSSVFGAVGDLVDALVSGVTGLFDFSVGTDEAGAAADVFAGIVNALSDVLNTIADVIEWATSGIKSFLSQLKKTSSVKSFTKSLSSLFSSLGGLADKVWSTITSFFNFSDSSADGSGAADAFAKALDIASGVIDSASSAVKWLTDNFDGLVAVIKTACAGPMTIITTVIKGIIEAMQQLIGENDGLGDSLSSVWEAISSACQELWPAIQQIVTDVVLAIVEFCQENWPLIQEIIETVMGVIQEVMETAWPVIQEVISSALEVIQSLFETCWPLIQEVVETAMPAIQSIIESVMPAIQGIFESVLPVIESLFETVFPIVLKCVNAAIPVIQSIIETAMPIIQDIFETVMPFIQDLVETVMPIVQGAFEAAMPVIQEIVETVLPIVQDLFDTCFPTIQEIVYAAISIIQSLIETAMPFIQTIFEDVMPAIQNIIETVWPIIQTVIYTVIGIVQGLIQTFLGIISGDWDSAWEGISSVFSTIWEGIQNVALTIVGIVQELIGSFLTGVQQTWETVWGAVSGFFATIGNTISGVATEVFNGIKSTVSDALDNVSTWWNSTWTDVKTFFSNTWNTVETNVKNGFDNVVTTVSGLPSKIKSFFSDAGSWLVQAGKDFLNGFKNGIVAIGDTVWSGIQSVGNGIKDGFCKIFGISSPSTWARDTIGQNLDDGIGVGISQYDNLSLDDVHTLCNSIQSQLSSALSISSPSKWACDYIGKNLDAGIGVGIESYADLALDEVIDLGEEIQDEFADMDIAGPEISEPTWEGDVPLASELSSALNASNGYSATFITIETMNINATDLEGVETVEQFSTKVLSRDLSRYMRRRTAGAAA